MVIASVSLPTPTESHYVAQAGLEFRVLFLYLLSARVRSVVAPSKLVRLRKQSP